MINCKPDVFEFAESDAVRTGDETKRLNALGVNRTHVHREPSSRTRQLTSEAYGRIFVSEENQMDFSLCYSGKSF